MADPTLPPQNILTDQGRFPFWALEQFIRQLIALLFGPGASTVVWRPGAASSGNVYGTWAEVVASVAALQGAVTIAVDTDLAAAIIPAGAWDLRPAGVSGPVTMVNGSKIAATAFAIPLVTIANAVVTIHGLTGIRDLQVDNRSTADVITTSAADRVDFYLEGFAALYQSVLSGAGVSFFHGTGALGGDLHVYMRDFTYIGSLDGGGAAIRITGGAGSLLSIEDASILDADKLSAPVGSINVIVAAVAVSFSGLTPYQSQAAAPTIGPFGLIQRGSAAIVAGTGKTAAIPAFITASSRILVTMKTPVGDALTANGYAALAADRVVGNPGTFQISALSAAGGGAVNGADTSTIDFEVLSS